MSGAAEDIFYILNKCRLYCKSQSFKMIFRFLDYDRTTDDTRTYTFSLCIAPNLTFICGKNVRNLHHSFCTLSDVKTVVYIKEDDAQVILAYLSNSLDVICQDVVREEESTMIILNRFIESLK
jgi:hypothetical protein